MMMAWKGCPQCLLTVRPDAEFCPTCGYDFRVLDATGILTGPLTTAEKSWARLLALIGLLLLALVAARVVASQAPPDRQLAEDAGSSAVEPVRFCPICEGTGQADAIPESFDSSGTLYHAEGSAWLLPSSRRTRSPLFIAAPMRCPRCHGRGLIGGGG